MVMVAIGKYLGNGGQPTFFYQNSTITSLGDYFDVNDDHENVCWSPVWWKCKEPVGCKSFISDQGFKILIMVVKSFFFSKGQKCPAIVDRALLIKPWEIFLRFLTTNPDSSGNWKCLFENDGGKNSFESAPIIYWLLSQSNRPPCLNCSNSEFCENNWKLWSDCSTLPKWTRVNTKLKQQTSLNILRLLPGQLRVDWGALFRAKGPFEKVPVWMPELHVLKP